MTDNELIAEFDGWTHFPTPKAKGKGYWSYPSRGYAHFGSDAFRYDTSWDWLMPVVEKINTMEASEFNYDVARMTEFRLRKESLQKLSITTPIDVVRREVVEFAKFYQQKP